MTIRTRPSNRFLGRGWSIPHPLPPPKRTLVLFAPLDSKQSTRAIHVDWGIWRLLRKLPNRDWAVSVTAHSSPANAVLSRQVLTTLLPAIRRTESTGWNNRVDQIGSCCSEVPVKWAFSRKV